MSNLNITRKQGFFGRFRKLKILVDGEIVASVGGSDSASIAVAPGHHSVTVKMDWVESQPLELDVTDGETVNIVATSSGSQFRVEVQG